MSIQWVDPYDDEPNKTLSGLIKSYLDKEDPSHAVQQILRLTSHLLLSNHVTEAHLISSAVFELIEDFEINDNGRPLDHEISTPLALEIFWHVHQPEFPRPNRAPSDNNESPDVYLPQKQWDKYRECTRTGWMKDRLGIDEPEDPSSVWRETNEPAMLAMCARLLAKTTMPCTYPQDNMAREAVEAAQKLYTTPEALPVSATPQFTKPIRHGYLLYRRLAVELAIRLGELQTAADLLAGGLMRDTLPLGGEVDDFLAIPGIYTVLPLLTKGKKESNQFFIPKEDAGVMAEEIISALKLRAEHGRQWELSPSKVGWRELLDRLTEAAWVVHNKEYRAMGMKGPRDILYEPATEEEITTAEEKFGELPSDFKEMVRLANGFKGGYQFFGGGIAGIQSMTTEYEGCQDLGDIHFANELDLDSVSFDMIQLQPGSECDGFRHYLITPSSWKETMEDAGQEAAEGEYRYWHWAFWQGEIQPWDSVRDFVAHCVEEVEEMREKGEEGDYDTSSP